MTGRSTSAKARCAAICCAAATSRRNTEEGYCKLYDATGTYVGCVDGDVMDALREGGEISTRHEDETYDTHWIKEELK